MTLRELQRSMEIKRENLERILHELEAEGRIVLTAGKRGMENISLAKRLQNAQSISDSCSI